MAHYRIHLLRHGGGMTSGIDANCDDDTEVRVLAQRLLTGESRAEICFGSRSLGQVSAASSQDVINHGNGWLKEQRSAQTP